MPPAAGPNGRSGRSAHPGSVTGRLTLALPLLALMACAESEANDQVKETVKETPHEDDVPPPVPAEVSLAGYPRFPDEGQGIRKLENRIIAYRRIADLMERELGVKGR